MAEPVGLALSALGIATLFNSALECFQIVRLGKAFEQDVETYRNRLNLLQLRLAQWGEAVGLDCIREQEQLPFPEDDVKKAKHALQQIIILFEEVEKKSETHGRRVSESEFSNRMKDMCSKMRGLSMSRMNKAAKANLLTKTKWALTGKKEFDQLVGAISNLINELIAAFPEEAVTKKREELNQDDAKELHKDNPKALEDLGNALSEHESLREALEKVKPHTTNHNMADFRGSTNEGSQVAQNLGEMNMTFGSSRR
ncbi:hypothetical protein HBI56_193690 [Parastagonospora nodorum]|nr:hypothetical protein HBH56_205330 [Parastagonospora nodorum]QRC94783.1 hypothetical protein JI435_431270 [Parastagonospora nodorum SN15]KAH3923725.1 hypothetical protein HBH54_204200 [Parastagonospora nodorum]KAH3942232.1 hypothetical protein HBH53_190130 [Parastagonospora nodorum]KAH3962379.1 hypothetical protein HBH51_175490 [Parastagonospora nodorum]